MVMRKRVLMAEQSDAIRGVAETVLRQNGFEVISVAAAEKALEVLKFSRPDLLIIGADLTTPDKRPLYDKIQSDPKTASIALLLFDDPGGSDLPFPTEVILPRPFDPREFLEKVMIFSGSLQTDVKQASSNPLGTANLDDDLLDAALGLDRIDVTDSEVIDKADAGTKRTMADPEERIMAQAHHENDQRELKETGKVETVMIRDTSESVQSSGHQEKKPEPSPSASSKLEILSDQYGLTDPSALLDDEKGQAHDYEWFINEMRKETEVSKSSSSPTARSSTGKATTSELNISEPASIVEPVTPSHHQPKTTPRKLKATEVEKFIDEFKKEIEKARADEPETIMLKAEQRATGEASAIEQKWEESFENVTAEQINLFTRQLCSELAEKIANKIVSKIDADKLLNLIKNEILLHSGNKT